MAGSRWGSDKVSSNNPNDGFEDQIPYPSKGYKYNYIEKPKAFCSAAA